MKITRDVQTNPQLGERGLIDVFLPEDATGPVPFVVGVHGGGWGGGDHRSYSWLPKRIVPQGWGLVNCTYRLANIAPYPAAYDDLVQLLKWLRRHGASLGLNADKAALLGGSAGGHLVSLLAGRLDFSNPSFIRVRAVASYCPVADLVGQYQWDQSRDKKMTANFIGGSPDEKPDAYREASPISHVHGNMPPMLLYHGDSDQVVPFDQSQKYAGALEEAGAAFTFKIGKGEPHTMLAPWTGTRETDPLILGFEPEAFDLFRRAFA